MASVPGPLCQIENTILISDGTRCLAASPIPRPTGTQAASPAMRVSTTRQLATFSQPQDAIQEASISLGADMSWDAVVRNIYNSGAAAIREQAQELVRTGQMTAEQAKVWSNGQRNALMQACRDRSSPLGRAIAQAIKPQGKSVADLEKLGKSAEGIIESAGRTNPYVNRVAVGFRYAGPALLIVGLTFSAYHIATAPPSQRWQVVAGEVGTWTGALAGGWAGGEGGAKVGAAIGTFIEPGGGTAVGGVIGAVIGTIGGAIVGGWIGSRAADYVYRTIQ